MTPVVELVLRRKAFPDQPPLFENLALQVRAGERVVLMGPSGIGKTTLLTILAGLDTAFEGELRSGKARRPRTGVMFQAPRLMPWLSVGDNIALVMNGPNVAKRVAERLEAVELPRLQNAFPKALSGGMQRRVALARAIANEPDLLILDEPFVSLDDALSVRLYQRILDTLPPSVAVIIATHNLAEAITLADRIVLLAGRPAKIRLEEIVPGARPRAADDVERIEKALRPLLQDSSGDSHPVGFPTQG